MLNIARQGSPRRHPGVRLFGPEPGAANQVRAGVQEDFGGFYFSTNLPSRQGSSLQPVPFDGGEREQTVERSAEAVRLTRGFLNTNAPGARDDFTCALGAADAGSSSCRWRNALTASAFCWSQ